MNDYLYIPISCLEKQNITRKEFMQNTPETQYFLEKLLYKISPYAEIKQTLLIYDYFVLVLEHKSVVKFKSEYIFDMFTDYIQSTKFKNSILVDNVNKEIRIKPNTSPVFYNVLGEFMVT